MNRKDLHARQFVRISGLGIPQFLEALQGVQAMRDQLATQLPQSTLSAWNVNFERGFPVLEASNRFFSSQEEARTSEAVELGQHVDPMGILASIGQSHRGVHVLDNEVKYYERVVKVLDNSE